MLNDVKIMGRLTKDIELRHTATDIPVASWTLAVERDHVKEKTVDFIDCEAWGSAAEFVSRYFRKGSMMVASGMLISKKWEDRNGNNRINWVVKTEKIWFGEPKRNEE